MPRLYLAATKTPTLCIFLTKQTRAKSSDTSLGTRLPIRSSSSLSHLKRFFIGRRGRWLHWVECNAVSWQMIRCISIKGTQIATSQERRDPSALTSHLLFIFFTGEFRDTVSVDDL